MFQNEPEEWDCNNVNVFAKEIELWKTLYTLRERVRLFNKTLSILGQNKVYVRADLSKDKNHSVESLFMILVLKLTGIPLGTRSYKLKGIIGFLPKR